jgi:hypothetical protein
VWESTARQLAKGEWKFRVEINLGKIMQGQDCILNFSVDRNEVS